MFVSHVNTFLDGGAATAARRLHEQLRRSGTDSRFYYSRHLGSHDELDSTYQPTRWHKFALNQRLAARIQLRIHRESFKRTTRQRPLGHEIFTSPRGLTPTQWPPVGHPVPASQRDRDILHLHWIAKFIDYSSFFGSLSPEQPIVWTLHDMNAFTGGCHFSGGCERYRTGCGSCPQLGNRSAQDISWNTFLHKQDALNGLNLNVVAPSQWLLNSAKSSPIFSDAKSFTHIPYGISTDDYYPMDRNEARARLGIDSDTTVVCFGAMDLKSRRKGARHLLKALSSVADLPNVQGLVFGSGELPKCSTSLPPIREVGPVHGLLQQRTLYSASDMFVLPSLEDNLPLTGLEAMACGTAIVGFDSGGIPDYVLPNQTGLLAPMGDSDELGRQIRALATQPELIESMGKAARKMIEQRYPAAREASDYAMLYNSLVESTQAKTYKFESYANESNQNDSGRGRRFAA